MKILILGGDGFLGWPDALGLSDVGPTATVGPIAEYRTVLDANSRRVGYHLFEIRSLDTYSTLIPRRDPARPPDELRLY